MQEWLGCKNLRHAVNCVTVAHKEGCCSPGAAGEMQLIARRIVWHRCKNATTVAARGVVRRQLARYAKTTTLSASPRAHAAQRTWPLHACRVRYPRMPRHACAAHTSRPAPAPDPMVAVSAPRPCPCRALPCPRTTSPAFPPRSSLSRNATQRNARASLAPIALVLQRLQRTSLVAPAARLAPGGTHCPCVTAQAGIQQSPRRPPKYAVHVRQQVQYSTSEQGSSPASEAPTLVVPTISCDVVRSTSETYTIRVVAGQHVHYARPTYTVPPTLEALADVPRDGPTYQPVPTAFRPSNCTSATRPPHQKRTVTY